MIYHLLGMKLDPTNYVEATNIIISWAKAGEGRSIFAANTHLVIESYDSPSFRAVVNSSDLVTSDGVPLVWWLRTKGVNNQQRVYGPDLMLHVCKAAADEKIPIGLLGSTQEVIAALVESLLRRFPGLQINFVNSPPFLSMSSQEDDILVKQILSSGIKILFVGLGCPKQEIWINQHKDKLQVVMLAVGAAFQLNSGLVHQAPKWMQNNGLEWLFRLTQEPDRLWKRYLVVIPRFATLTIMESLGLIHVH